MPDTIGIGHQSELRCLPRILTDCLNILQLHQNFMNVSIISFYHYRSSDYAFFFSYAGSLNTKIGKKWEF